MNLRTDMGPIPQKARVMPAGAVGAGGRASEELGIRLSYGSLHDLAGPANQLCTLTSLLIKQYGDRLGPDADALIDLIRGSMSRLQNLMDGFRLYAQVAGKKAPEQACDANALMESALAALRTAIQENGVEVTYDRLPELHCDAAQIGYVFTCLVENAIKFHGSEPPKIQISAISSGDFWILAVRDNGIGIDPKHHRSIFEMFKRVHPDRYPGVGVGLAIAEHIVETHGGKIWVESELGRGATFLFTLPGRAGIRREPEVE